ncbi:MAG: Phenylalanine-tRNA ligase beta subunit [Candidatus Gottesmanbacteria bacterium GW2011_GWC2_39_8]|uniref:Phenylalanine--tRNA ligase beta subunit n=1 Tax=Candidatus Gottesmanbacteria bacterium GW2011_GWC2_39_8 TaxID=1618450 RepID=A0A0G0Q2S0_9BACT|nr:MAG: Phenylalanine-tRNA ligase beta subunit [Candidatus Gottesmanbacteria bacterium GW2011_GWC2_39_8]
MNILVPDSWLREYLDTDASPEEIQQYLSLSGPSVEKIIEKDGDKIYDIEVTTNRVDMASVFGIAQEAVPILPRYGKKARLKKTLEDFKLSSEVKIANKGDDKLNPIDISPILCPRYTAVIIENVTIRPSPKSITDRLEKVGVRSLNNVVDTSNYLMTELGQPIHTFDYDKIKGHVTKMRLSKKGEKLVTLDGKIISLPGSDIIYEDGEGRLIDLCGIMGGKNTEVDENTKSVLFYVQTYNPTYIRKTSMNTAQRTHAATLFEKGLDPERVMPTLVAGIEMMEELSGGRVVSPVYDLYPNPVQPKSVKTSIEFINARLGVQLTIEEISSILESLKFKFSVLGSEFLVVPPSYRTDDIAIPEDIVEEVARIYGYHNLPNHLPTGEIPVTKKPKDLPIEEKAKTVLKYLGFTETYSYSMLSGELLEKAGLNPSLSLKISNPLTREIEYMRPSLIPQMLVNLEKNQYFKDKLSLFELSKVYIPRANDLPEERSYLVIAQNSDFYALKGTITSLSKELGIGNLNFTPEGNNKWMQSGKSAVIKSQDVSLGSIGQLNSNLGSVFQLKNEYYIAEIDVSSLPNLTTVVKNYKPVSGYPPVIEDLSFEVPTMTYIGEVIANIYKIHPLISLVELIDTFETTRTLRITYSSLEKNLANADIENIRKEIVSRLENKYKLKLKGQV